MSICLGATIERQWKRIFAVVCADGTNYRAIEPLRVCRDRSIPLATTTATTNLISHFLSHKHANRRKSNATGGHKQQVVVVDLHIMASANHRRANSTRSRERTSRSVHV